MSITGRKMAGLGSGADRQKAQEVAIEMVKQQSEVSAASYEARRRMIVDDYLSEQGLVAVPLNASKRAGELEDLLSDIIRSYNANSGYEPSVSVLARDIDVANSYLIAAQGEES
jgi:hypothetical protein